MKYDICKESHAALALMEQVLRDGAPVAPDYPLVFGGDGPGELVVAEEDGEVRSTCAILARDLVMPGARVRVGMIGSVSTDPLFRGRGLASAVLERAEQRLAHKGCLLSLLWAEDPSFYVGRGYVEVGAEWDFPLAADVAQRLPGTEHVRPLQPTDAEAVLRLYEGHDQRMERSEPEMRAMLEGTAMRAFVHCADGELQAYACMNRGGDLSGVVHEWGGDGEALLSCLRRCYEEHAGRESDAGPVFVMAPAGSSSQGLATQLEALGVEAIPGILGMGRLLSPVQAQGLLSRLCKSNGGLCFEPREDASVVVKSDGREFVADRADLLRWILSPRGDRGPLSKLEEALGVRFGGLPLLPFVWGLDSI